MTSAKALLLFASFAVTGQSSILCMQTQSLPVAPAKEEYLNKPYSAIRDQVAAHQRLFRHNDTSQYAEVWYKIAQEYMRLTQHKCALDFAKKIFYALTETRNVPDDLRARCWQKLAKNARRPGNVAASISAGNLVRAALNLGESNPSFGPCLCFLGDIEFYDLDNKGGYKRYLTALEWAINHSDKNCQALAMIQLGNCKHTTEEYKTPEAWYLGALSVLGNDGYKKLQAKALLGLGNLDYEDGQSPCYVEWYIKARDCAEQAGKKVLQTKAIIAIGHYYFHRARNYTKALTTYQEAKALGVPFFQKRIDNFIRAAEGRLQKQKAYKGGRETTEQKEETKGPHKNELKRHMNDEEPAVRTVRARAEEGEIVEVAPQAALQLPIVSLQVLHTPSKGEYAQANEVQLQQLIRTHHRLMKVLPVGEYATAWFAIAKEYERVERNQASVNFARNIFLAIAQEPQAPAELRMQCYHALSKDALKGVPLDAARISAGLFALDALEFGAQHSFYGKVLYHLALLYRIHFNDLQMAREYENKAIAWGINHSDREIAAEARIMLATAPFTDLDSIRREHELRSQLLKEALGLLGENGNSTLRAKALIELASLNYTDHIYSSIIQMYKEALTLLGEDGDAETIAQAVIGLGNYYCFSRKDFRTGLDYYEHAYRIAPKTMLEDIKKKIKIAERSTRTW